MTIYFSKSCSMCLFSDLTAPHTSQSMTWVPHLVSPNKQLGLRALLGDFTTPITVDLQRNMGACEPVKCSSQQELTGATIVPTHIVQVHYHSPKQTQP